MKTRCRRDSPCRVNSMVTAHPVQDGLGKRGQSSQTLDLSDAGLTTADTRQQDWRGLPSGPEGVHQRGRRPRPDSISAGYRNMALTSSGLAYQMKSRV